MIAAANRVQLVALFATLTSAMTYALPVQGAELKYPYSIAVAEDGTKYLADRDLPGVWKLNGEKLAVLFQGSKKYRTLLNAARCVELDHEGKLLVGDSATRDVYRFDEAGQPQPLTRDSDGIGRIGIPMDIAVNSSGEIYVADLEIQRVVKIPAAGGEPTEVAQINGCRGLAIDAEDNVWVISTTKNQLHRISPDGKLEVVVAGQPFEFPHTVVIDDTGVAYVCDGYAKAVWKVEAGKDPVKLVSGEPLVNPVGMAKHGDQLLVVDPRAKAIFQIAPDGKLTTLPISSAE